MKRGQVVAHPAVAVLGAEDAAALRGDESTCGSVTVESAVAMLVNTIVPPRRDIVTACACASGTVAASSDVVGAAAAGQLGGPPRPGPPADGSTRCVAPSSARELAPLGDRVDGDRSARALATFAPWTIHWPRWPSPTTATLDPGWTCATLKTAPEAGRDPAAEQARATRRGGRTRPGRPGSRSRSSPRRSRRRCRPR